MTKALQKLVSELESYRPELERERSSTTYANDVFEAVDDLLHLAHYVIENNTRVDYPGRVRQERQLWKTMTDLLPNRPAEDRHRYAKIFGMAEEILRFAETIQPPKDGHLGILRIIREHFSFLQTDYGFAILKEEPIGIRFSSGTVYVELEWAKKCDSSCSFGPESNPKESFWIDDLLFLYGDARYRTLPQELTLNMENDVESWFKFLADIFRQYGHDVLTNQPGIFEKLAKAQSQRGEQYTQEMDRLYGKH